MNSIGRGLLLLLIAGVAACGSDSPTSPTPPADDLMPTLSSIQDLVFNASCVLHHGNTQTDGGLDLRAGQSFNNLVSAASTQVALNRVEPNDAENSYLIHKLEGRAGISGDRMPVNGPFLSQADIDVIKQWINDGAEDN